MKSKFFLYSGVILAIFLVSPKYAPATTGVGLPCPGGGPDYRDKMTYGKIPGRIQRMDENGEGIRYSPSFDAIYNAQCIDPTGSNATQTLFDALTADQTAGVISKCDASDKVRLDPQGHIQFCAEEADEYFFSDGNEWILAQYDDGSIPPPPGGAPFPTSTMPPVPTQGLPTDLGQLIQQIFGWSLSILGIAVFVMFFYSGFLWLTAAGNTSKIGEARTHMTNAVFGAILLLSSYLILYTINPDFVKNTVNLPGLGTSDTNQP